MLRAPAVVGQFYSAGINSLKRELSQICPEIKVKKDALGLLLPHAGYMYSGRVAGETVARVNLKDVFVIIGPNHTGIGELFSVDTDEIWQTPLGEIGVNVVLAKELLKNSRYLKKDSAAHSFEHSIEVQLPFLQYIKPGGFTFVPIIIGAGDLEIYKAIGREIAAAIKKAGLLEKTQVIASSDMTHYEEADTAKAKDKKALDAVLKLDPDLLFSVIKSEDISMCGYAPAVIMLTVARNLGAKQAELVKYENSGDTTGDYSSVVGYAGIIIS